MADKFEYFDTGENTGGWAAGNQWQSQGFGPQAKHQIEYIKLKCYSAGTRVGTLTYAIYPSQGSIPNGKPDVPAGALVTATIAGSDLPNGAYAWKQLNFATFPTLDKDTLYHIVFSYTGAGFPDDYAYWRANNNGGYPRGQFWRSLNGGVSWDDLGGAVWDFYFEEWGTEIKAPGGGGQASQLLQGQMI